MKHRGRKLWIALGALHVCLAAFAPTYADEVGQVPGAAATERAIRFPALGMHVALPADSVIRWVSVPTNESQRSGRMAIARGVDADSGITVCVDVLDSVAPLSYDKPPTEEMLASVGAGFGASFDSSKTEVTRAVVFAGLAGVFIRKVGAKEGRPVVVDYRQIYWHGQSYTIHATFDGAEAPTRFAQEAKAILDSVKFDDPRPWAHGPVNVVGTRPMDRPEGTVLGDDEPVKGLGFEARMPAGMARVPTDGRNPAHRFAWAARSEDRTNFAYIGLDLTSARERSDVGTFADAICKQYMATLRKVLEDFKATEKRRKSVFPVRFAKQKGIGYEVRGTYCGSPFLERCYVGKAKNNFYMFRVQYVGPAAEKQFGCLIKKVEKSFKAAR